MSIRKHFNTCFVQEYQQCFSDAFAALLDLDPGHSHPMVYLYCLKQAMHADGQLSDVVMPAHQVKMDSSVPWDIINVETLRPSMANTRNEQTSGVQKLQARRLNECSRQDTALRCDSSHLLGVAPDNKAQQQQLDVSDLVTNDDPMTPGIRDWKSPVSDPINLLNDDDKHHNRFQEELSALENLIQLPNSDNWA
jgi:hypothetical protein